MSKDFAPIERSKLATADCEAPNYHTSQSSSVFFNDDFQPAYYSSSAPEEPSRSSRALHSSCRRLRERQKAQASGLRCLRPLFALPSLRCVFVIVWTALSPFWSNSVIDDKLNEKYCRFSSEV